MARTAGSHSEITGPRVRTAALALFAQHGYAAVSMRQIAKEVGVQAGALYLYTPDKQTLLFELMRDHLVDLLAAWQAPEVAEDAESQMIGVVRNALDCLESGAEPELSHRKALRAGEVIFAFYESVRRHARVELPLEGVIVARVQSRTGV